MDTLPVEVLVYIFTWFDILEALPFRLVSKHFDSCVTTMLHSRKDDTARALYKLDTHYRPYPLHTIMYLNIGREKVLSFLFAREAGIRCSLDAIKYYCEFGSSHLFAPAVGKSLARKDRSIFDFVVEKYPDRCGNIDKACRSGDISFVKSLDRPLTSHAIIYAAKSGNADMVQWVLDTVKPSDTYIASAAMVCYLRNNGVPLALSEITEVLKNDNRIKKKYFPRIKKLYEMAISKDAFIEAILRNVHNINETCWMRHREKNDDHMLRWVLDILTDATPFSFLFKEAMHHNSRYIDTYLEYVDARGWQSLLIEIPILLKHPEVFRRFMPYSSPESYIGFLVTCNFHEGLQILCGTMPEAIEMAPPFVSGQTHWLFVETLLDLGVTADEALHILGEYRPLNGGSKTLKRLVEYCRGCDDFDDVLESCIAGYNANCSLCSESPIRLCRKCHKDSLDYLLLSKK